MIVESIGDDPFPCRIGGILILVACKLGIWVHSCWVSTPPPTHEYICNARMEKFPVLFKMDGLETLVDVAHFDFWLSIIQSNQTRKEVHATTQQRLGHELVIEVNIRDPLSEHLFLRCLGIDMIIPVPLHLFKEHRVLVISAVPINLIVKSKNEIPNTDYLLKLPSLDFIQKSVHKSESIFLFRVLPVIQLSRSISHIPEHRAEYFEPCQGSVYTTDFVAREILECDAELVSREWVSGHRRCHELFGYSVYGAQQSRDLYQVFKTYAIDWIFFSVVLLVFRNHAFASLRSIFLALMTAWNRSIPRGDRVLHNTFRRMVCRCP